jgi:hypothetical protein
MITIFLGIIAVTEVLLFVKVMVDFALALYFRKQDKKDKEELDKTIKMLAYSITEIDSRVKKIEMPRFNEWLVKQTEESKQND